jgi:membrane protein
MKLRNLYALLKETVRQWIDDNTSTLGAAQAFYAVFAFAPLAVVAVTIAAAIFGEDAARGELYGRLENAVGPTFAQAIEDTVRYTNRQGGGVTASIISIVVILFGAAQLFNQLQQSMNIIWGVHVKPGRSWWVIIKDRLMPFVVMILVSLLLLASLISSTVIQTLSDQAAALDIPDTPVVWRAGNWLVSFALTTLVFALVFKVLPDVEIRWREVAIGAPLTTILFLIGNFLIGLYLSKTGMASAYGAAGSLVVILLWVYYSSQVLLLGAEFTQVYATHYGNARAAGRAEALPPAMGRARKAVCDESSLTAST